MASENCQEFYSEDVKHSFIKTEISKQREDLLTIWKSIEYTFPNALFIDVLIWMSYYMYFWCVFIYLCYASNTAEGTSYNQLFV